MHYFIADPRDGMRGSDCSVCCCQNFGMRPGESNALKIDYAAWVLPFGNGAQLIAPLDIQIERNADACSNEPVDGFTPPTNSLRFVAISLPVSGATAVDLSTTAGPSGNTFEYRVNPLNGPRNGSITPYGADWSAGQFSYTPAPGFAGTDVVWFDQRDAQGRVYTFPVQMRVGASAPTTPTKTGLSADGQRASIAPNAFIASIPISLAPDAKPCERYRMTVKATARDCSGNLFTHYSCYDVTPGQC